MNFLKKLYNKLIVEAAMTRENAMYKAVKNRNPITFWYAGKRGEVKSGRRVKAECVAIGRSKQGNMIVRAWVQPPSTSKTGFEKHGWRTFIMGYMTKVEVHWDETFDEKRPGYKEGDDASMSVTYVTSKWEDSELPEPKPKDADSTEPETDKPSADPHTAPAVEPEFDTGDEPQDGPEDPQAEPDIPQDEPEVPQDREPLPSPNTADIQYDEPVKDEKPPLNPEDDFNDDEEEEDENLNEQIKRIKELLSY